MMLFIVACWLTDPSGAYAAGSGQAAGVHASLGCRDCHQRGGIYSDPAGSANRDSGCAGCHRGHGTIFAHAMATRTVEKRFVERSYGRFDSRFFEKNCTGCHVGSCRDCHGSGHRVVRPKVAECQVCHKGYFTGWDFSGRAPREDNLRYQRGIAVNGETFLKMLPDVHYAAGMSCGSCHSMASLARGAVSSKGCRDCHTPSSTVLEHRIPAHLERLECYACHSAWAPQEYGTFFLRFRDTAMREGFRLKPGPSPEYLSSAFLRMQDAPPLGINGRGRVSPIRPQFIAYYTDIMNARNGGPENILTAAEWRAFFPHTVQRGSVTCDQCHDNPRRFLLEPKSDRIHRLDANGMGLASFWDRSGQRITNGSFMDAARYRMMSSKNSTYTKAYIQKWKTILTPGDSSSPGSSR